MLVYENTRKYRKYSEDRIVINENLFFVFDGEDDISQENCNESSPTSIFLDFIVKRFSKCDEFTTPEQVSETLAHIINEFIDADLVHCLVSTSACGALVHEDKVTFFSIGDGSILINHKNKTKLIFDSSDLKDLNKKVLNETKQLKLKNPAINPMEHPYTFDMICKNRAMANKPKGYKIISNAEKVKYIPFKVKTCSLNKLDAFAIMSHGFFNIFEPFNIMTDYNELFASKKSLDEWQDLIKKAEKEDEYMYKFNRLKPEYDSSIIKVLLK